MMKSKRKENYLDIENIIEISDRVDSYIAKNYDKMIKRGKPL